MPPPIRPTRAEIDLDSIVANARALAGIVGSPGRPLFAVVKADAYGHGAVRVARALAAAGAASGFAVSLVEEGVELREAGVSDPILVMGPALDGGHEELCARAMIALASDPGDVEALAAVGRRRGREVEVHLKVDTGMGRLGILPSEVPGLLDRARRQGGLRVTGLATHLACADLDRPEDEASMTREQLLVFEKVVATARRAGLGEVVLHAANSAACLRFPESHLDWVRPGLALYGGVDAPGFRQAMRLSTRVAQLRVVPPGTTVSYGATWRAGRRSRLAVLPVGYADGLTRAASGRFEVLVSGRRCPLVGAISMDIVVADVTDLGEACRVGDPVVILGAQGDDRIGVAEFARRSGLIEYEVTCGISKRVPRVYS